VLAAPPPSADPPVAGPFSRGVALGARLLLAVDDAASGTELWATDGTLERTAPVLDLPGADLDPLDLRTIGDHVWFSADPDDGTGRDPWITDGTAEGTHAVADVAPAAGSEPLEFTGFDGRVAFSADDGVTGREIWLSDGSPEGTGLLLDLRPGPEGSAPHDLVVLDPH